MKRILLFTLLIFLSIFVTQAQFGWGVKGGLTMGRVNLNLDENLSGQYNLGGHAGVFCRIGDKMIAFQPELMFIQKGVFINDMKSDDYSQTTLNYLEIPIMARASLNLKAVEIYFNCGAYGSYLLSSKQTNNFEKDLNGDSYAVADLKDYDAGIVMGVGFRVLALMFEIRYGMGLLNISNDTEKYRDSKNTNLNISLGVQF